MVENEEVSFCKNKLHAESERPKTCGRSKGKGKGEVQPRTGHEGPEVE
jgi:hypothetical protein